MLHTRLSISFVVFLVLIMCGPLLVARQANAQPKLFKRYESASYNRIIEDVLTLTIAVKPEERSTVAVRVCSKEPLPWALVTAAADPFQIAELLTGGYGYLSARVVFLRYEDCPSKRNWGGATEIWTLPQGASLPPHVEELVYSQAERSEFGKRTTDLGLGVGEYKKVIDNLVKELQNNPTSRGLVIGYYLKRPSAVLQRRLTEIKRTFARSGLPPDRYLVRTLPWNGETSDSDPEPRYPAIFIIKRAD
jgi:hypothetical protein